MGYDAIQEPGGEVKVLELPLGMGVSLPRAFARAKLLANWRESSGTYQVTAVKVVTIPGELPRA